MRTTLLNPTVWVLVATVAAATLGAVRGEDARRSLDRVVRWATTAPVLAVLLVLAAGGLGSRLVLGFLSPGAYAEEVLAARAFLAERTVYGGDDRAELAKWMTEAPGPADPWTLPGVTPCQASAMNTRPQFYTSQGHPPMLLLASVPVVHVVGGRGLYVLLTLVSLTGVVLAWRVLATQAGLAARSGAALLLGAAIFGWQPVIAGLRQGDAVVLAGSLVVVAWRLARQGVPGWSGLAGGLAACLTLPALAVIPALTRTRGRAAVVACAVLAGAGVGAMAAGGLLVFADFSNTLVVSSKTYAEAIHNYAVVGRLLLIGTSGLALAALAALSAVATFWRGRSIDVAMGAWMTLGLLASPIVWSQHLVLALVPIVVLFQQVVSGRSALTLAAWALLVLVLSLPDPAVAHVHDLAARWLPALSGFPVVSIGLVILWAWLIAGTASPLLVDAAATRYGVAPAAS